MSLTIENETDWDGRHLRQLCRRVIEHTDGYFNRTITVKTSKKNHKEFHWERNLSAGLSSVYRGRASVNSRRYLYMGVPKPIREVDGDTKRHEFNVKQFARVLEHEIAHNRGLRHGDMIDDVRYCQQDVDYVDDLSVKPKPSCQPAP